MIKKIDHYVITTSNLEECKKFYTILGFEFRDNNSRNSLHSGDFKINVHKKGQELFPHADYVATGTSDFCLEIDSDLLEFKNHLEENGIESLGNIGIKDGAKGIMHSFYIRDYDKNLVEICSYK